MNAGKVPTTDVTRLILVKGACQLTGCLVLGFVAVRRTSAGSRRVTMYFCRSPGAMSGGSVIVKPSSLQPKEAQ